MAKSRGFLHVYRTYNFVDKDPVIDRVRTLINDEGLSKNLNDVHLISGVARATLDQWFNGKTKQPRHSTVAAIVTSLGYEETFVKKKELNVEKEKAVAAEWYAKQEKNLARRQTAAKKKRNGRHG